MPVVHPEESLEMELGMSADGIWKRLKISEGSTGKVLKISADEIHTVQIITKNTLPSF